MGLQHKEASASNTTTTREANISVHDVISKMQESYLDGIDLLYSALSGPDFVSSMSMEIQEQIFQALYEKSISGTSSDHGSTRETKNTLKTLKLFLIQTDFLDSHMTLFCQLVELTVTLLQNVMSVWTIAFQRAMDPTQPKTLNWFESLEYSICIGSVVLEFFGIGEDHSDSYGFNENSQYLQTLQTIITDLATTLLKNDKIFPYSILYEGSVLLLLILKHSIIATDLEVLFATIEEKYVNSFFRDHLDDNVALIDRGTLSYESIIPLNLLSILVIRKESHDKILSRAIYHFSVILECFELDHSRNANVFQICLELFNDIFTEFDEEDAMTQNLEVLGRALLTTDLVGRLAKLFPLSDSIRERLEILLKNILICMEQFLDPEDNNSNNNLIREAISKIDFLALLKDSFEGRSECLQIVWSIVRICDQVCLLPISMEHLEPFCSAAIDSNRSFLDRSIFIALTNRCFSGSDLESQDSFPNLLGLAKVLLQTLSLTQGINEDSIEIHVEALNVLFDIFGQDFNVVDRAFQESGLAAFLFSKDFLNLRSNWIERLASASDVCKHRWEECFSNLVNFITYKKGI